MTVVGGGRVGAARPDVESILARFPGPVRLTAAKGMIRIIMIGGLIFEFLLGRSLLAGESDNSIVLLSVMIVMAAPILRSAVLIVRPDGLALTLSREGFTLSYLLRAKTRAWSDVGDFSVWKSRRFDLTAYNDRSRDAGMFDRVMARFRKARFERDAVLPDTYHLGSERLAKLMTLWQQRALPKQEV
jgi:hypothetical protein